MPIGLPCPARFLHSATSRTAIPYSNVRHTLTPPLLEDTSAFDHGPTLASMAVAVISPTPPQTHQLLGTEVASVEIPLAVVTKKSEHIDREYSIPFQLGPDHDVGNDLSSG